jgi:hypothetical protein
VTSATAPPVRSNTVWGVTLAAFAAVSFGAVAVAILSRKTPSDVTLDDLPTIAMYVLFTALPVGLPAALLGGWLATWQLGRSPRGRPLSGWLLQGAAFGALLGASVCVAWIGLATLGSHVGTRGDLSPLALVGAALGLPVGLIVGAWCWRISRPV